MMLQVEIGSVSRSYTKTDVQLRKKINNLRFLTMTIMFNEIMSLSLKVFEQKSIIPCQANTQIFPYVL